MQKKAISISGLDVTTFEDFKDAVNQIIKRDGTIVPGVAIAINAEKIMFMRSDPEVHDILQSATLRYPDGIGVVWALNKKGANCSRIPGCELWEELMQEAGAQNLPVFIVGAKPETLQATKDKLFSKFGSNLVGSQHGYFKDEEALIWQIKNSGAKIVTVAMGSPVQEHFIAKCKEIYPEAFYMGVGGTYDVFVGNIKRAPAWARKWHLEWFYRLIKQPTRIKRQLILVKFIWFLLWNKL